MIQVPNKQNIDFVISPELQAFIPPLSKEEYEQLEANILAEGIRDALVLWVNPETGEKILVDGHNRYTIAQRNGIENFDIKTAIINRDLEDLDAVKGWMIQHQLGKRNFTEQQKSYMRGEQYRLEKKRIGKHKILGGQNVPIKTYERLSEQHRVSEKTIQRDEKFAQAIDEIGKFDAKLKLDILNRNVIVSKSTLERVSTAGKMHEFAEALSQTQSEKSALDAVFPLGERTRIQASMEFPPTAPEEEAEEEAEEDELTPEEKEIIEGIRAIHPALADQFENGEIVCEHLNIHAKLFAHPEELQKVYFDAFFETKSIEKAYNIFHEHRQKAQKPAQEEEPQEEQKEPDTTPAQPLVIKSYPAQHDVFVVYGVNTLTGKNKLQNAVVDFVRQYINLAFNDFTAIYEGVEKELDRLNSLYKNCAPLKVGKRESEHGASIWITPKDSTVSFEASIICKKITKILEGASLGEKNGTPSQQTQPTAEERKTQINLLMLYKLKKMEMEGFNKVCILRVEGNKVMEFISFRENQMEWVEMLELESNAQAKKEMDRICDKNPYCIKLNF